MLRRGILLCNKTKMAVRENGVGDNGSTSGKIILLMH